MTCVLLCQAVETGDAEAIQELVLKFGQVSAAHYSLINICDKLGYTMLHYAIMYEKMDCIAMLIELGAGRVYSRITLNIAMHVIVHRY